MIRIRKPVQDTQLNLVEAKIMERWKIFTENEKGAKNWSQMTRLKTVEIMLGNQVFMNKIGKKLTDESCIIFKRKCLERDFFNCPLLTICRYQNSKLLFLFQGSHPGGQMEGAGHFRGWAQKALKRGAPKAAVSQFGYFLHHHKPVKIKQIVVKEFVPIRRFVRKIWYGKLKLPGA